MSGIVTIFGGSGFVGRYITRRMANAGWRVRVAVRRPNEALFVRTYGAVGQVEPILANVRDDASTAAAVSGADVVINCVGILAEDSRQKFEAVQAEGAGRIARAAAAAGVKRLVHLSAIGADATSDSDYARSKAEGEALVLEHFPDAVILRPSVVFGPEDQFFNRFAGMARLTPILPIVGGNTRFQPVYVDDVAAAAEAAALGRAEPGIYELGGPDVETMRQLMERMLRVIRRRCVIVNLPFWMARIDAAILDFVQAASLGLIRNRILTRDQVRLLRHDNVVHDGARGFSDLGITPRSMDAELEVYLYPYRPQGQFTAIQESASRLRA